MKKIWIGIIIVVVILAVVFVTTRTKKEPGEIKIGAILPLTGNAALYGQSPKKGIDLALEEINEKGGIKGNRKLVVIYEDSKAVPTDGVTACRKLVNIDKVSAIIGGAASSVTLAIAPIAENNRVVVLSPLSSAPAITNAGDFIFRIVPSDMFGGKVAAFFAVGDQEWKSLAILYINNDFGVGLTKVFSEEINNLGGKVLASETYEQGSSDFRTQLSKIKLAKPDALYIVGYREAPQILIQLKEMGLNVQVLGTGDLEDPNLIKIAKKTAEGIYFTQLHYDINDSSTLVQEFVKRFRNKYGSDPDIFAAYGYDAMKVLAFAIAKSKLDSESIKNELYKMRGYRGVTGSISFDQNGDVVASMGVKVIRDGKFVWFRRKILIE